jgi:hypothetical protein
LKETPVNRTPFRPQLEALEARVVPAAVTPTSRQLLSDLPALIGSAGSSNLANLPGAANLRNQANGSNQANQTNTSDDSNSSNSTSTTGRQHLIEPVVSTLGFGIGTLFWPIQGAVQQQTAANKNLTTDVSAITSDINGGASAQTIAAAYSKASSDLSQVQTLDSQVKTQARTDEVFIALNFLSHTLNSTDQVVAGLTAFLIQKNTKTAASTLSSANATAGTAQPGGFPTVSGAA